MATISKKLLTTERDFPYVKVWEFERDIGPTWVVDFWNREWGIGRTRGWTFAVAAGVIVLWAFLAGRELVGGGGWAIFASIVMLMVGMGLAAMHLTTWVNRSIELDPVKNTFKVLEWWSNGKKSRTDIVRDLYGPSGRPSFEVRDHPDAEAERQERAMEDPRIRTDRRISKAEKSHCLIGYFGARGADRVTLITRAEWPNEHSLMEVQQAVLWTMEQIAIAGLRRHAEPDVEKAEEIRIKPRGGINTVLD